MKKAVIFSLVFVIVCVLCSCEAPEDKVLSSLGRYNSYEFYTQGEFQDYTDYAKYYFCDVNVDGNEYFTRVQAEDTETINEIITDFEGWIKVYREADPTREIVVNYHFDRSVIDSADYFYVDSEKSTNSDGSASFLKYNLYIFDTQTNTLYYFHNNI
ncbi:MAG: hypothetical protein J6A85_05460 [Clostridia bacterium]|nr:hypothetical protein [Clostridia bacterium]